MQTSLKFNSRGDNAKKASKILQDNKKEYQRLLKAEIAAQKGKKDVCKAAKAASKKHKKMSWKQAMRKAATGIESSNTDVSRLKFEAKNGFRWKKNTDYIMRYEGRIAKAYQIWAEGDIYSKAIMVVKSNDSTIGKKIIDHLKKDFPKDGCTISYNNTTYGL